MTNASENLRACPTRADGVEVLIAHSISTEICHERQRRTYHKCFTCEHRGQSAKAAPPTLPPRAPSPARPTGVGERALIH